MADYANKTFDEIEVGTTLSYSRLMTRADVELLMLTAGDFDLFHPEFAKGLPAGEIAAQGSAIGVMVFGVLNRGLPGPGTMIVRTVLRYGAGIRVGDTVTVTVTALAKQTSGALIDFECRCVNQEGVELASGQVTVAAPLQRVVYSQITSPEVMLRRHDGFIPLFAKAAELPAVPCAVVHPCDRDSLQGAIDAAANNLIVPHLIGPEARIRAVAAAEGIDISPYPLISVEHSHAAAAKGVELARAGQVHALMKGSLHTDELMEAVVSSANGLRTARRISHVFVMDVPAYPRLMLITDAAINIEPDLHTKVDICQNAIDLAHVLGIEQPRVAILSAVETVTTRLRGTIDAAALCKMADRGQIKGGILDGPLAFDNAVSTEAARIKGIQSPVAGAADVLLVPDLEAGNMLAKQQQYLAGADSAGIVLGARVPIVLTSRADSVRARLASAAVMKLVAEDQRRRQPAKP